jgi:hypothetical protein
MDKKNGILRQRKNFDQLKKEREWCEMNNINFTPEILINGKSFPKEYDRADLQYFINDLIDEELQRKETKFEYEMESEVYNNQN